MKNDYKIHPLAELFPEMAPEEFAALKNDIATNGQQDPIVLALDNKTVLDGRHRLKACVELGVIPKFINFCKVATGAVIDTNGAETAFIWTKNFLRRHLSADQRAAISLQWSGAIKAAAKQRMRDGGKGLANSPNPIHTREAVAKQAHVSTHKIRQAEVVAKYAPDLMPKVAAGAAKLKDADAAARVRIQAKSSAAHVVAIIANHPDRVVEAQLEPRDPGDEILDRIFKHLATAMDLATQRRTPVRLQPVIRKLRNYADQLEATEKKNAAELKQRAEAVGAHPC
jgi:ParB-like nuclease domain